MDRGVNLFLRFLYRSFYRSVRYIPRTDFYKGAFHLNPKPVRVSIGQAIAFESFTNKTPEQLRDHVRGIISDLSR